MAPRRIFLHEDDCEQIELLPLTNWAHCQAQMAAIDDFSQAHRAPDGVGWTDMLIRDESPVSFASLGFKAEQVAGWLCPFLPPFDHIDGDAWNDWRALRAFGLGADAVIFMGQTDGVADALWLNLYGPPAAEQSALLAAFDALVKRAELLLADWGWSRLYRLDDAAALAAYLRQRESVFTDISNNLSADPA